MCCIMYAIYKTNNNVLIFHFFTEIMCVYSLFIMIFDWTISRSSEFFSEKMPFELLPQNVIFQFGPGINELIFVV